MSAETVIATDALTKHYGDVHAVESLDLDVRRGEIYAFLGRNGAGKTTTIRMLLGLIRPTRGSVTVLGTPIVPGADSVFGRVGYLVETATAYPNLTVRENLDIQRRLTGAAASTVAASIEQLRLAEYADRQAGQLSLGNLQRLALARALMHRPDVLVLDEPANALDPAGIVEVRGLLRSLADNDGVTVFMSSHILAEVAHLADRIGIVNDGRLLEELDYDELLRRTRSYIDVGVSDPKRAAQLLRERLGMHGVEPSGDGGLRVFDADGRTASIARTLVEAGLEITALTPTTEDLETYFLRLTGGGE